MICKENLEKIMKLLTEEDSPDIKVDTSNKNVIDYEVVDSIENYENK